MKISALLLLLSFSAIADERFEYNQHGYILTPGYCMAIFKGLSQYGWCITKFSNTAEQKIAAVIAERLAFETCNNVTINCRWYKTICAN